MTTAFTLCMKSIKPSKINFLIHEQYKYLPENHSARQLTESMLDNMCIEDELLIHNGEIYIPLTARKWIIDTLHGAHAGKNGR